MESTLTQEQIDKLALLKKNLTEAKNAFLKNRDRNLVLDLMDKTELAEKELKDYEDSLVSPEQLAAQTRFDAAKEAFDIALKAMNDAKDALKKAGGKVGGGQSGGDHSRHISYEDAQNIRKDFAAGVKTVDITKKYGNSTSSVGYIVNYLQHKLRKGDTAHTPLINKFYPAKWKALDGSIKSGAPYFEDKVKENNDRYKGYAAIV